ncbi:MAG: histidine kinase [Pseudolabrys sp.]
MPSLIRFLFIVGVIAGIGYGIVFALANFVPLKQREITVTVPPQNFLKR